MRVPCPERLLPRDPGVMRTPVCHDVLKPATSTTGADDEWLYIVDEDGNEVDGTDDGGDDLTPLGYTSPGHAVISTDARRQIKISRPLDARNHECSSGAPLCKRGECIVDVKMAITDDPVSGFDLLNSLAMADDAELSEENADTPELDHSDDEEDDPMIRSQPGFVNAVDLDPDDDDDDADCQEQFIEELRNIAPQGNGCGDATPKIRPAIVGSVNANDEAGAGNPLHKEPRNVSRVEAEPKPEPQGMMGPCWSFGVGIVDHLVSTPVLSVEALKIWIALDSGAVDHCANLKDLPGDVLVVNDHPKRKFVNASGDDIDYWGQAQVRLEKSDGRHLGSSFQVMDVCRPLHSTSKICDQGCNVIYTDKEAVVISKGLLDKFLASVNRLATYPRAGGLYVAEMTVKAKPPDPQTSPKSAAASPFGRQGPHQ